MNIENLKTNDRVIVTMPGASANQVGPTAEVTVVRIGKEKTAIVVRESNGRLRTLPIVSVKSFAKGDVPASKPARGEEAVIAVFEAKHGKVEAFVDIAKGESVTVETLHEVGQQVHAAILDNVEPTSEVAKQIVEEIKKPIKAVDLMDEAEEFSQKAKAEVKKLRPSKVKKEKAPKVEKLKKVKVVKEKKTGTYTRLTKEQLEERKVKIKKLVDENKLSNKEIAEMCNCDPAIVSNARTGYVRYQKKGE